MNNLVIKKARLLTNEIKDIEIQDGTILKIEDNINVSEHINVIDLKGEKYVSAGWIDMHTHCFNKFKLYSDNPDEIGYKKGVTTVVDAGTAGANTIEEFYNEAKKCKTNVLAYINIAKQGISTQDELADLNNLDGNLIEKALEKYKDFIVGIKVRMSKTVIGENGIKPLEIGVEVSKATSLPLMVHIGSAPPTLEDILNKLRKGDVVSHIFNGKPNGIIGEDGNLKECVKKAKEKGVYFDLAHGTDSFNFEVCTASKSEGVKCHAISTDIYMKNRVNGPVYDLSTTMTKLLNLGYTLEEVVDMVTLNPAKILGREDIGNLKVGCKGDITIFKVIDEKVELIDSNQNTLIGNKFFKPLGVILNGEHIKLS